MCTTTVEPQLKRASNAPLTWAFYFPRVWNLLIYRSFLFTVSQPGRHTNNVDKPTHRGSYSQAYLSGFAA